MKSFAYLLLVSGLSLAACGDDAASTADAGADGAASASARDPGPVVVSANCPERAQMSAAASVQTLADFPTETVADLQVGDPLAVCSHHQNDYGDWAGVIVPTNGDFAACAISDGPYTGPCASGWIQSRYIGGQGVPGTSSE